LDFKIFWFESLSQEFRFLFLEKFKLEFGFQNLFKYVEIHSKYQPKYSRGIEMLFQIAEPIWPSWPVWPSPSLPPLAQLAQLPISPS
jgi:hypothetical protein